MCDGRGREPSAAGLAAMPLAGVAALDGLPAAGRGQRRGSCDHGADRPPVSGSTLLRLAPDGGVARDPRPQRQSQAGAAADAAAGVDGNLSTPEHEQTGRGAQGLSVSPRWDHDRAGQSGVVLERHLHPDRQGLSLPGGRHGLGEPCGAGLAAVQHTRRQFLCRGARRGAFPLRPLLELFDTNQGDHSPATTSPAP